MPLVGPAAFTQTGARPQKDVIMKLYNITRQLSIQKCYPTGWFTTLLREATNCALLKGDCKQALTFLRLLGLTDDEEGGAMHN